MAALALQQALQKRRGRSQLQMRQWDYRATSRRQGFRVSTKRRQISGNQF
jgi:hypothetical protein